MPVVLRHLGGTVYVQELPNGKRQISVRLVDKATFMPHRSCQTTYSLQLIREILEVKGPAWLCDEIMRDQDYGYVQSRLERSILSFVPASYFTNRRLLDFGCGAGASTVVLARMLPRLRIVGVDMNQRLLELAKLRAQHYGLRRIEFFQSPDEAQIPDDIGSFDFVMLNAVFEHLLPVERALVIPQLWNHLKPWGILFVNETPNRDSPIEYHTTWLPLINYLPDRLTFILARRLSDRVSSIDSWEKMLREGIRGTTEREILGIMRENCRGDFRRLRRRNPSLGEKSDLRYVVPEQTGKINLKQVLKTFLIRNLPMLIMKFGPLSVAIQKSQQPIVS